MLVLKRKPDQRVTLLERRTGKILGQVIVCELTEDTVQLGLCCPDSVTVIRNEVITRQGGQTHASSKK